MKESCNHCHIVMNALEVKKKFSMGEDKRPAYVD